MSNEELLNKYEQAAKACQDSVKNNSYSYKTRNQLDIECGKVYQLLVKAGMRQQIKKKYRG